MGLKDDLQNRVRTTFKSAWSQRDGSVVPEYTDIALGNNGVNLDAVMLYADLDASTKIVDQHTKEFAAEIYKTFLYCAASIIKSEGGEIRSYDGDRVMGIFIGNKKNTSAVRCGLKINYVVVHIIQPTLIEVYTATDFTLRHVVGIDASKVLAIRTGVRGDNDLAWIGRSPNYAAKLCTLNDPAYNTWITKTVYDAMMDIVKFSNGKNMWEERRWNSMNNMTVYRSNWWWSFS